MAAVVHKLSCVHEFAKLTEVDMLKTEQQLFEESYLLLLLSKSMRTCLFSLLFDIKTLTKDNWLTAKMGLLWLFSLFDFHIYFQPQIGRLDHFPAFSFLFLFFPSQLRVLFIWGIFFRGHSLWGRVAAVRWHFSTLLSVFFSPEGGHEREAVWLTSLMPP